MTGIGFKISLLAAPITYHLLNKMKMNRNGICSVRRPATTTSKID